MNMKVGKTDLRREKDKLQLIKKHWYPVLPSTVLPHSDPKKTRRKGWLPKCDHC